MHGTLLHILVAVGALSSGFISRAIFDKWLDLYPPKNFALDRCSCRGFRSFFVEECPHIRGDLDDTAALRVRV